MVNVVLRNPGKRRIIKEQVVRWIREQGLQPGEQIMGQNQLAEHFGTTVVTIHKALSELSDEGVLHRVNGRGTFVGPNPARVKARSLCLVLPGEHLDDPQFNPHFWPYVQRIYRAFMECIGHAWTFTTRGIPPGSDLAVVSRQLEEFDGVFFHYAQEPRDLLRFLIRERRVPVVSMGLPKRDIPCMTVDHDRVKGAAVGVRYLLEHGYSRIGFVGSREAWGEMSFEGYRAALKERGLPVDKVWVARTGELEEDGDKGMAELLKAKKRVEAVFVDSDLKAMGVMDCLRRERVEVPGEIGVMGYDGLDNVTRQSPYLTTVAIPYERMIKSALAELLEGAGEPTRKHHLSFVGEVLPGKTTRQG